MDLLYNAYIKIQPVGKDVLLENDEYTYLKGFVEVRITFIKKLALFYKVIYLF